MYDPNQLIREYQKLEHGSSRISGIQYAIEQAEQEKDYPTLFSFYYDYAHESVFYGDSLQLYLVFPKMLQLWNEYPDLELPSNSILFNFLSSLEVILFVFKWVLGNVDDFYQISLEDINRYFEEFKRIVLEYGFSLRSYYQLSAFCYQDIDPEKSKESYLLFLQSPRDIYSDCEACETQSKVSYELLYLGREKKALQLARPLFNRTLTCATVLSYTYGNFLDYYLEQKDYKQAEWYYKKLEKEKQQKPDYEPCYVGESLRLLTKIDLQKAWLYYKKYYLWAIRRYNPTTVLTFDVGAACLFRAMSKQKTLFLSLPKTIPLYREGGQYQAEELASYYETEARKLAEKFDLRNGTDSNKKRLEKWLELP